MTMELSTRYDSRQIEDSIYALWETGKHFHTEVARGGRSYTIVIPPPNVTGALHMGHALNNTVQDILVRWRRMQGCNTLWLPGCDHAGIATQNVVEREIAKENQSRWELGREAFLKRVWQWKDQYGSRIMKQLRKLGSSCDWDRERFTMDAGLSRAVVEAFNRLFECGLIYRGKYIVNWCPFDQTTLADDEVDHEEHDGHLWYIKYPIKGEHGRHVTVATTRPETMLGDTAVAVNPADERYQSLIGKSAVLPLVDRAIPIIADDFVDPGFGTGCVKVTPAHDPNDFEMGRRHDLPFVNVMKENGRMNADAGEEFVGMDRLECREVVLEQLRNLGLLDHVEPHTHSIGHCYRCNTVIEPYLSDQWFVKMKPLAQKAIAATRDGRVSFHPERWTNYYLDWLEKVRDWPISRQIWWGHRIPVWYCLDCNEGRYLKSSMTEGAAFRFKENAIPIVARTRPEKCLACGSRNLVQDEDVLDTWFSSALWPFSTLGWPEQTPDLDFYYPTSTLVTDRGIIFFWVARMVMMGLEMMEQEPFSDVYIHGTILDEEGRKMSKSLGNGIDPIVMIDGGVQSYLGDTQEYEGYGADAVRFSLVMLTTEGQDVKLSPTRFEMGRNFANKLWNATRLTLMNLGEQSAPESKDGTSTHFEDTWIRSRLNRATREATDYLESFKFNEMARTVYEFFWHDFCDWYLEIVKPRLYNPDSPAAGWAARETLATVLDGSLRLLHPVVPFITEFLWQKLKEVATESGLSAGETMAADALMSASWPRTDASRDAPDAESEMELTQSIIRAVRAMRRDKNVQDRSQVNVVVACPDAATAGALNRHDDLIRLLAGVEGFECAQGAQKPPTSATSVVGTIEVFMALGGLVDLDKERDRLQKQASKLEDLLAVVARKLENPNFVDRAPVEIVQRERDRQADLAEQLAKVQQNLADLG